jgi:hypothetical protein
VKVFPSKARTQQRLRPGHGATIDRIAGAVCSPVQRDLAAPSLPCQAGGRRRDMWRGRIPARECAVLSCVDRPDLVKKLSAIGEAAVGVIAGR